MNEAEFTEHRAAESGEIAAYLGVSVTVDDNSGVLWGIEPTAKEIEVQQMAFVRIEDGDRERWFL